MFAKPEVHSAAFKRKIFANTSHLQEISLVVNTGGVYQPEE